MSRSYREHTEILYYDYFRLITVFRAEFFKTGFDIGVDLFDITAVFNIQSLRFAVDYVVG
jgi:hypothetical protein